MKDKKELRLYELVGLEEDVAAKIAYEHKMRVRILSRDGKFYILNDGVRNDRVNLNIVDGKVSEAKIG